MKAPLITQNTHKKSADSEDMVWPYFKTIAELLNDDKDKTINKSQKEIIEHRLRGWDESWRWVKNHQNIIFVCRAVEWWQGQRCKKNELIKIKN